MGFKVIIDTLEKALSLIDIKDIEINGIPLSEGKSIIDEAFPNVDDLIASAVEDVPLEMDAVLTVTGLDDPDTKVQISKTYHAYFSATGTDTFSTSIDRIELIYTAVKIYMNCKDYSEVEASIYVERLAILDPKTGHSSLLISLDQVKQYNSQLADQLLLDQYNESHLTEFLQRPNSLITVF